MKPRRPSPWLVSEPETDMTRVRLVCFPFAGGNASLFRAWSNLLPSEVHVCAVQLPGRHRRLAQRPMTRMAPLVSALEDVVARLSDLPVAFFGQCSGALIGYELARQLQQSTRANLAHVFIAASPSPEKYAARKALHALPDDAFFAELERMGGTPPEVLASPELREFAAPALRSDLELVETYVDARDPAPLDCPITTFRGAEDAMVTEDEMRGWRARSRSAVTEHTVPGSHYLLDTSERAVLDVIEAALSPLFEAP